ncbi:MAG: GNAT family N-acetyltransferase [Rickettsiales bacterium]|jgi:RimJ/RimL family protein N-acetyltransferase|nr:GNAT family N-acetyltransferase [Rickettsiales bacterium]
MKPFSDIIIGPRVELRSLAASPDNAEIYYKFLTENQDNILEFDNLYFDSAKDILEFLERIDKSDDSKTYGIYRDGQFIGYFGFEMWNERDKWVSLYFALATSATGNGLMTEALNLFADEFFARGGNRMQLTCCVENLKSIGVAVRCGFKHEGVMRKRFFYVRKGTFLDDYLYSKIRDDIK